MKSKVKRLILMSSNYRVCLVGFYLLKESIRQWVPGTRACTSEGLWDQNTINQHQLCYLFKMNQCFFLCCSVFCFFFNANKLVCNDLILNSLYQYIDICICKFMRTINFRFYSFREIYVTGFFFLNFNGVKFHISFLIKKHLVESY